MSQASVGRPEQKLWTTDFVLTLLTAHLLFAAYSGLFTVVPSYVLDRGGQEWQIGVVVGSFGVMGMVIRPFSGRWIYHLGAKRVAVAGLSIFAIASFLYIPVLSVWWLVPVRMLQGIGLGIAPVATSTMTVNLAPAHRRAEALAYMGNSIASSTLYAPVLGFWLLTNHGFTASFVFTAGCAVLGAIIALLLSAARTGFPAGEDSGGKVPLISRAALFPTAVFLTYTLTTAPLSAFLPLLAEDRQLGNPSLFFSVNSATTMLVILVAGPVADRAGRATVIIPGLLATAASMFLLTIASNQAMLLVSALLVGAGFGLLQPGIQSLTIDRVPARERGAALATLQSAWDIGISGGSFVLGPIATALGVAATFGIVGTTALMGTVGFIMGNARTPATLPDDNSPQKNKGKFDARGD